jgi:hypothetical protein
LAQNEAKKKSEGFLGLSLNSHSIESPGSENGFHANTCIQRPDKKYALLVFNPVHQTILSYYCIGFEPGCYFLLEI